MLRWPNADRRPAADAGAATGPKVKPVLTSRPASHQAALRLGSADYGYAIVADKFAHLFGERGIPVREIDSPEQAKGPLFYSLAGLDDGAYLHLIFRPADQIRVMVGAYNVAWFSWPFDRLRAETLSHEVIVNDQVRMLRACDEVWTPCAYTQAVLVANGIDHVHVVPAPIATIDAPRTVGLGALAFAEAVPLVSLSAVDEASFRHAAKANVTALGDHAPLAAAMAAGRVFLTVCDPTDRRKNLPAMIDGFIAATHGIEDAVLLVKLVNWGTMQQPAHYLFHQIRDVLGVPHCIHEDRIVLFAGTLSDADMTQLYGAADFYLCTSVAEGQNLPLLEAMGAGCIPVSVANTAMADFITAENAVVIAERRFTGLISGVDQDVIRGRFATAYADPYQIATGITAALALDAEMRAAKVAAARATVLETYSEGAVMARLVRRLNAVRPDVTPAHARLRRSWWR